MSTNLLFKKTLTAFLLTLILSVIFTTANAERDRKGPPKGKPPAEAFSACANLTEESACSYNNSDGETIAGMCKIPRKAESSLVCKPNRGKNKGKHQRKRD